MDEIFIVSERSKHAGKFRPGTMRFCENEQELILFLNSIPDVSKYAVWRVRKDRKPSVLHKKTLMVYTTMRGIINVMGRKR